jgi:butyryl-CoA dehydrogenase
VTGLLTEEQAALRDMAAAFARKEVEPIATRIDLDEVVPGSLVAKAAELGLFGLYTDPAYGGAGADLVSTCLVLEEIAKASPAFAGTLTVQMVLCPQTVELLGSEAQKLRLLVPHCTGERPMAYAQSEPAGTANITAHLTRLTPHGPGYVLNGAKLFCTQGSARTYLVMCRTRDREGHEGFGCAIVDREAAGLEVGPYEDKLGWRGTNTGPLSFDDVAIGEGDILGDMLTAAISHKRANVANVLAHSATAVGCAQGLFDKTLDYVKQRRLYGRDMHELQPISYWLADCHARIVACRALVYSSVRQFEAGVLPPEQPHICKAFVCETAFEVTVKLLQMWGGAGIMNTTGVNRFMRDARAKCVAEGASEMHQAIIANHLLHGRATLVPPSLTALVSNDA